ncbi:hypothetical protein A3C89_04310 [Candidatus Kaiserbacteria bacterium RIFCSPHIGHO2_02_FULL_50_50]|uniref:Uncharacterized protein n=1 Tax=Candidatus Kaiserbacteria bacterium RIFCSPHIGHO2_02_FULL_50_50 TaxID=1798492 RepID=A0A1F6DDL5_9BACT|nr:MAG: hypothetical protein A3C89_04310 [Candidatus Kaiserbacteria bacterium RIFCSPHIGHO2_02_FULL_50_50]OGG88403.1 MAG: hypothetical protein A3G62_02270 [Candidatus Kaiserbacteria bacterium RIFCSPLOWO2_12_FULL_50_10]
MMCYDSGMQKNNEKGSALTLVIAGTFSFFAVLAVVLWYFFSYAPEQRRLEGVQAIEAVREQEQAGKEDIGTPLAGTVKICTKQEGEIIVRYYLNGPRVRVAELTTTLSRVSIWDGELLARYDANGSKKWFKVPDAEVAAFHELVAALKADASFTCEERTFDALHFKRIDDPLALEK